MAGKGGRLRGKPLLLSPRDVAVAREWHEAGLPLEAVLRGIDRFFAREARPGESLATDAIGAIGWYSGLPVYGAHGLVDPVLARRQAAQGNSLGLSGMQERLSLSHQRPAYPRSGLGARLARDLGEAGIGEPLRKVGA